MTHIGLLCPTASGHLNPMTTLGYELKQRGHQVTLIGTLDAEPKVQAAGLAFRAIGTTISPRGSTAAALTQLGQLSGMEAFRYTIALFQQMTNLLLQEAPGVIREEGIELLLIDQTSFGGSTIAQHLDLPFISVCCALMLNRDPNVPPINTTWPYAPTPWARLRNQAGNTLVTVATRSVTALIAQARQQWNLPPLDHPNDAYSQLAQLCQQPPGFEFPRQSLPPCFHFTGPYSNPASREPVAFPFDQRTG